MLSATKMLRVARACVHSGYGVLAYRLGWHTTARRQFERVLLLRGADFRAYVHLGRIAFDLGDYAGWRREFEHARRTDPARFARLRHPMELFEPRLAGTQLSSSDPEGFEGTDARATWRALRPSLRRPPGLYGDPDHRDPDHRDPDHRDPDHREWGASSEGLRLDGSIADGSLADGLADGVARADLPLAPGFDPLVSGSPTSGSQFEDPRDGTFDRDRRPRRGDDPLPDASLHRDDFASAAERRRFQLRRPIDRREIARCNLDELLRRLSG